MVEDLESGNGTFVDGSPVQERRLVNGDAVEIQPFLLTFRIDDPKPIVKLVVEEGADEGNMFLRRR